MARPPKGSLPEEDLEEEEEEEEEPSYGEDFTSRHDSSSHTGEAGKLNGKKGNTTTPRSKHSETEQRRRSKINERFQVLRDIIPQNDQKRDKASFLLEVIEYIHFLQERLQMYEGGYHYNQEPTKLTPWRNNSRAADSHVEPAHVMRNGMGHENSDLVNYGVLTAAQNSLQPDIEDTAVPLQMQSDELASVGRCDLSGTAQQSLPNAGNVVNLPEHQCCPVVPFAADYAVPKNSENQPEQLDSGNGSESLSSAYSQEILNNLTQALRNSGVYLSEASISVQIDVGKRAGSGAPANSTSKDHETQNSSSQAAGCGGESDQGPNKRPRKENN